MEAVWLWAESGVGRSFHSCTSGHLEEDAFGARQHLSFPVTARLQAVINVCDRTLQIVVGGRVWPRSAVTAPQRSCWESGAVSSFMENELAPWPLRVSSLFVPH